VVWRRDAELDAVTTIRFSITRQKGWYRKHSKFWVISESIPQKRVVWSQFRKKILAPSVHQLRPGLAVARPVRHEACPGLNYGR